MILPQHLRIGNTVWWNKEEELYYHINMMDFSSLNTFDKILPIQLTPEILEKLGFTLYSTQKTKTIWDKEERITYTYLYKDDRFTVSYSPDDDEDRRFRSAHSIIVNHLHQLQNLFFVLTGGELIFIP